MTKPSTEARAEPVQGYRKTYGVCDDCNVIVIVEMHPDAGPDAVLPDYEDWDRERFPDCPVCGGSQIEDGSDPTTTHEDETARLQALADRYERHIGEITAQYTADLAAQRAHYEQIAEEAGQPPFNADS